MSRFNISAQIFRQAIPDPNWSDVAGDYTLAALDDGLGLDAGSGNMTLTLTSVAASPGRVLVFERQDNSANTLTITPYAGDTIGGLASLQLYNQGECLTLRGDAGNTNWVVVSHDGAPSTPSTSTQLGTAKAAASTNLTLSGTQTVDGVGLLVGDICLATSQATAKDRGPYVVQSGAWTRPSWYATGAVIAPGGYVVVERGSQNGPALWLMHGSVNITVDTTATVWVQPQVGLPSISTGGGSNGQVLEIISGEWTPTNKDPRAYFGIATVTATSAITLSGTPTVDGTGTSAGSIILAVNQGGTGSPPYAAHVDNGPWQVTGAGAMVRPYWYATGAIVSYGSLVFTGQGTAELQTSWELVTGGAVVGTDPTAWIVVSPANLGGGTVTSISGPTGITWATATTTPAGSWASQTSGYVLGNMTGGSATPTFGLITILGTIGTGVWNGTGITVPYGGTGAASFTAHGVMLGNGASALGVTAAGSAGQVLRSGGGSADPTWSTATYPATAGTSGNVLTSDGTNFVSSSPAATALPSDYISGCNLLYSSTTQIQVNTGTVGLANGLSYTVASVISNSPTLAASTLYYVFLTSNSAVTVSSTAPSNNYQGSAWNDGTTSHRYVGSFLTDASAHIYKFQRVGNEVRYKVDIASSPFAVTLANVGTSTSKSFSSLIPATSTRMLAILSGVATISFGTSDGTTPSGGHGDVIIASVAAGTGAYTQNTLNLNSSQALLYFGGAITAFVIGYLEDR